MNIQELRDALKKEKKFQNLLAPSPVEFFPTGSIALDAAIGGGWPKGRIIEIFSEFSGGKTTLALEACVQMQRLGGMVAFIDMEHALDPAYAKALGVDLDAAFVVQPDYGEEALDVVIDLAARGVDLIVVDSVAALVPKKELDGDMEDSSVGLQARMMGQALRKLAVSNSTVIFINQVREKIGVSYGNPETTPGGKALPFYASVRVRLGSAGKVEADGVQIGKRVRASVKKNKVGPPFREAEFDIIFGVGIDKVSELADALLDRQIATRSGAWFTLDGERFQGRAAFLDKVRGQFDLLQERVRAAVYGEGPGGK